ncbi:MAG: DUF45 domain-containing protein [Bacilli bacterium]|nr:DUF45 domain-containing protein [Bacilli bacterium]
MVTYCFNYQGKDYNVKLINKKVKTYYLRIDDHTVVVTGYNITKEMANNLIISHIKWIDKHLNFETVADDFLNIDDFNDFKIFYLLGNKYDIEMKENKYYLNNHEFSYKTLNILNEQKRLREFFTYLIEERVNYYKSIFNHDCKIVYKDMKSKYGYNSRSKNLICLSTRLVHLKVELIDYVIVHEYCHFKYYNHQKEFYNEVKKYYPNYKKAMKELKLYSPLMK